MGLNQSPITTAPLVQAFTYTNPDHCPPLINAVRVLSEVGFEVNLLCRENGENWNVSYPSGVTVTRLDTRGGGTWREFLRYVRRCFSTARQEAVVFWGHDMH